VRHGCDRCDKTLGVEALARVLYTRRCARSALLACHAPGRTPAGRRTADCGGAGAPTFEPCRPCLMASARAHAPFLETRDAAAGRSAWTASRQRAPLWKTGRRARGGRVSWLAKKPATETGRGRYAPQSDKCGVARPGSNHGRRLLANAQVRKVAGASAGGCGVGAQKFEVAGRASGRHSRAQAAALGAHPVSATARPAGNCAAAERAHTSHTVWDGA
jgi:hypothetical protein